MREVTQGFVTCNRPEDAKPMGNLETASQALLLAALKGKLTIIKIYFSIQREAICSIIIVET